jgi:hypothetical protein
MVADDMSIATARTRNQRRAAMIALFRDVVMRAMAARHAGEGKLVERRAFEFGAVAFAGGSVFGGGFVLGLLLRRARDGVCEAAVLVGRSCSRCDGERR